MATYTDNYNLTKPTFAESADIRTINGNMDTIDSVMHASQVSLADAYDETRTSLNPYNTGDIVMYELLMYKCLEDGVYGTWDGTKWERTTAGANGGGSDVTVTPSYNSGTKVAEIDVDGETEEIYVPEMTGASSQADGTAGLPPAPEAGDENKFFRGDGTWAEVGGGSGGKYSEKILFEQPYNTAFPSTITLSESFENFDALGFYFTKSDDNDYYDYLPVKIFSKSTLTEALNGAISGRTNTLIATGWQMNNSQYARFQVDSNTQLTTEVSGGKWNLKKITGIKFGIGSSGGSGYTTTLLYDSGSLVNGAPYGQDIALLGDLSNYDMALLILGNSSDLSQSLTSGTTTAIIDTSFTLTDSATPYYDFHWAGYSQRWLLAHFTDTTFNVRNHGGDVNQTIYRIYGIKFGGGSESNVEPNPQEEPTDTLSTIRIGDTVFDIAGSGGSYAETVIYENTGSTQESSMTLTDDITKYDLILFEAYVNDDNRVYTTSGIYRASTIISGWSTTLLRWSPSNQFINIGYVSSTELTCYSSSNMYIKRIVGLKCGGGSGGNGTTSEIIPITAGDNTTSRTFTFDKKPVYVVFDYLNTSDNWRGNMIIEQGASTCFGTASNSVPTLASSVMMEQVTWSADGKSVTITGHNSFGAINTTTMQGNMFVYYGGGSGERSDSDNDDLSGKTWTLITSTTGTSAEIDIPSGTEWLVLTAEMNGRVSEVGKERMSNINKLMDVAQLTIWGKGYEWADTLGNHTTISMAVNGGKVSIKSGYNTVTAKIYAVS